MPAEQLVRLRARERRGRSGEAGGQLLAARHEPREQVGERETGERVVGSDEEGLGVRDVAEAFEQLVAAVL